jgi:hypothetical protein
LSSITRYYESIGSSHYVEVVRDGSWYRTRIIYADRVNDLSEGVEVYHSIYTCSSESELEEAIYKAQRRDFGLWGADEDY